MKTLRAVQSSALAPNTKDIPYVYRIVPHNSSALAAISSDDTLRAFTTNTLKVITEGKHEGVTCLQQGPGHGAGQTQVIITAGRKAQVKLWDGRVETGWKVTSDKTGDLDITSLASCSQGFHVATGMEQAHSVAGVAVWDIRSTGQPVVQYAECHNDDVTELMFSSSSPTTLLSGSTDGLVNVYDTSISDEDDALLQVVNHGASIHHAGFVSPTGLPSNSTNHLLYALSHDETFSLYHRSKPSVGDDDDAAEAESRPEDEPAAVFGDIRPMLDCEYVVDVLSIGENLLVASGKHSEQRLHVSLIRHDGSWNFDATNLVSLEGAHGEELVRTIMVDQQTDTIYTGGEDGIIKIWRSEEQDLFQQASQDVRSGPPGKQKKKKDKHFKPY